MIRLGGYGFSGLDRTYWNRTNSRFYTNVVGLPLNWFTKKRLMAMAWD